MAHAVTFPDLPILDLELAPLDWKRLHLRTQANMITKNTMSLSHAAMVVFSSLIFLSMSCGTSSQTVVETSNFVRCQYDRESYRVEILLREGDPSVITLSSPTPASAAVPYSVSIPNQADEVARLVRSVAALAAVSSPQFAERTRNSVIKIECRQDHRVYSFQLPIPDLDQDNIWRGVVDEIKSIGQCDLATAIYAHHLFHAGSHLNPRKSSPDMELATSSFEAWQTKFARRYMPGDLFEPQIATKEYVIGVEHFGFGGLPSPSSLKEHLHLSDETAVELAEKAWNQYVPTLVNIEEKNNGATVQFTPIILRNLHPRRVLKN